MRAIRFIKQVLLHSTSNYKFIFYLQDGPKPAASLSRDGIHPRDGKMLEFIGLVYRKEVDGGVEYGLTRNGQEVTDRLSDFIDAVEKSLPAIEED